MASGDEALARIGALLVGAGIGLWVDRQAKPSPRLIEGLLAAGLALMLWKYLSPPIKALWHRWRFAWKRAHQGSAALTAFVQRGDSDPARSELIQFVTRGERERTVQTTGRRPTRLRFLAPTEATVRAGELPANVPCGDGRLIVKVLSEAGVSFEEDGTAGQEVRAEIWFD